MEMVADNGSMFARDALSLRAETGAQAELFDPAVHLEAYVENLPFDSRQAVLVLASQDVAYHEFSFPFDNARKVENAIAFELASDPEAGDFLLDHVKAVGREPGFHRFIAAQVRRETLRKRIQPLESAGLQVKGITTDLSTLGLYVRQEDEALVMETGEQFTLFALYQHGQPVLLRTIPIGLGQVADQSQQVQRRDLSLLKGEIKRTIHSFSAKSGTAPDRIWVTGTLLQRNGAFEALQNQLALQPALRSPQDLECRLENSEQAPAEINAFGALLGVCLWKRKGPFFNFMKDEFLYSDKGPDAGRLLRWSFVFLGVFLLTFFLSYGLDIAALQKRHDFLSEEIRKTFSSAFPEVNRVVEEVKQARNLLAARQPGFRGQNSGPGKLDLLDTLHRISATIPQGTFFQIMSLFWETGKIELLGRTDSFKTVNTIQELLAARPEFSDVTISNARQREGAKDVEFKISIRIAE
jgi:type II secretory pathway component PulL